MNSNYECKIIQDLIPLCIDKVSSKQSDVIVKEHIKQCEACRSYYAECRNDKKVQHNEQCNCDIPDFSSLSGRIRRRRRIRVLVIIGALCLAVFVVVHDVLKYIKGEKENEI